MDVVIIGAGGHGRDCHQLLDDLHADGSARDLHLIGYVDDNPELAGHEVQGLPVLGVLDWLARRNVAALMGIGYPQPRYAAQRRAAELGVREWPTLVHPNAYAASRAALKQGVHLAPGARVGPNASIGAWSIVNINALVGHDSVIGEHTLVAAGVAVGGGSHVGEGVLLGLNAALCPCAEVGDWAEVGMNAAVTRAVAAQSRVFGAPARPVTTRLAAD